MVLIDGLNNVLATLSSHPVEPALEQSSRMHGLSPKFINYIRCGKKNAFLPDLTRVCGSTGCTDVCNLKPSDSNKVRLVLACYFGGERNTKIFVAGF